VLFDLGGTLIDPRDPDGWCEVGRSLGVAVEPDHLRHVYDEVDREFDIPPPLRPAEEFWQTVFTRAAETPLAAAFGERFVAEARRLPPVGHLFSDAKRCLDDLVAQDRRLGVVSNSRSEAAVKDHLRDAGILDYFPVVVSSGTEGVAKPDGEIFRRAVRRLELRPAEAFYVGDMAYRDAIAARTAGLGSVWLNRYGTGFGEEPPEITTLSELPEYILRLEGASVK
jgi:FMN phosphatase YigB (HAD superfamily)